MENFGQRNSESPGDGCNNIFSLNRHERLTLALDLRQPGDPEQPLPRHCLPIGPRVRRLDRSHCKHIRRNRTPSNNHVRHLELSRRDPEPEQTKRSIHSDRPL